MAADPPFDPQPPFELPEDLVEDFLCARFGLPDVCSILMPGGLELAAPNVLELVGPALTPLAPLFAIMEAVVAVKKCIDGAVDAISALDPGPLIECVPGLARLVDKLLSLLPQRSIPQMAVDLIDCALKILLNLRSVLLALQAQLERIGRTLTRAAELDDDYLNTLAICASDRLADTLSDEMKGLIVLGRIIGIVVLLLDLAGVEVDLPDFEEVAGAPLDEIIDPIDALIEALQGVRDLIPLPA